MRTRYPAPLRPGDRVGVTAPSSGVPAALRPRLDVAVGRLRDAGYDVTLGECLDAPSHVSASATDRAAELTAMLCDPAISAVVPPWGGETGIDVLRHLDWDRLAAADPTWLVGYSDISTLLLPLTTRLGWASAHAENLLDSPYESPDGALTWRDALDGRESFTQRSLGVRAEGWHDWAVDPTPTRRDLVPATGWSPTHGGSRLTTPVEVTGRLIGGCLETLANLAGTPYGDVARYGGLQDDGLIVYLEAAQAGAYDTARSLHGLRLAGWFEHANAVLIGRTAAPDERTLTQREAVLDALGDLPVPVVLDVECSHVPPLLTLVNGARARVTVDREHQEIEQHLA